MNKKKLWAAQYSIIQGFFDICPLDEAVQSAAYQVARGQSPQYSIIKVCGSFDEGCQFAQKWLTAGYAHNLNPANFMF